MVHFERAEAGAGGRWRARWRQLRDTAEAGMSTAEYAVGTAVICGCTRSQLPSL